MGTTPNQPAVSRPLERTLPRVFVATTAMLSFISFWRAAAVVLNDLASSAYYAAGDAEAFIGRAAPWFVLGVMFLSYAVRAIYIESCSIFVRGGVYRVVKESMGPTAAKISVSALLFDYILTGPISAVTAGLYFASVVNEILSYEGFHQQLPVGLTAVVFAVVVTGYFWWQNVKGVPESSAKALRIMQLTTVMVVLLLGWSAYTIWVRRPPLPPAPLPHNLQLGPEALGWLYGWHFPPHFFALLAIFVGLGHSILAMSGEETLAQVYREIEHPKLQNLKKAGLIIFVYSLVFTGLGSVLAGMIIPPGVRQQYLGNLIGGLAMNLEGPYLMRLAFHAFVVFVGALILSGAVNTAIVGANGVLNRISEDGALPHWLRRPHRRYGTSYRIISIIALLQLLVILISRGNFVFLGDLYAFGVIWSFAMKGLGTLVLRYHHELKREYKVPLNVIVRGVEIPVGLGLITAILLLIAVVNLFTKPMATVAGVSFTVLLSVVFAWTERRTHRVEAAHVELDEFNLQQQSDLSREALGVRPGNCLVAVGNYYHLYHLEAFLDRMRRPEMQDVVVLHVRLLRRGGSGEHELAPDQLFTSIEQLLFTRALQIAERRGIPIHLAMVAANDVYDAILRSAQQLESAVIVVGASSKMPVAEQARLLGQAWERLPLPKPQIRLEIFEPDGNEHVVYLGPHPPRLTPKEIDLLHNIWLRVSQALAPEEVHHNDVVHFALEELQREIEQEGEPAVLERLRHHLEQVRQRRPRS